MATVPSSPKKPNLSEIDWPILAEMATQEQDPDKLIEIIKALNSALDKNRQHGAK